MAPFSVFWVLDETSWKGIWSQSVVDSDGDSVDDVEL